MYPKTHYAVFIILNSLYYQIINIYSGAHAHYMVKISNSLAATVTNNFVSTVLGRSIGMNSTIRYGMHNSDST